MDSVEVREVVTLRTDDDPREGSSSVRLLLMSDGTILWQYEERS